MVILYRFEQLPFSSEESPSISLNKTQDDKDTERVCETNGVPIMDETMRQSSKSTCKPQEENDRSKAAKTGGRSALYAVEEGNDLTSMSKGSNDNFINFAVHEIDAVGGMLDNSANPSSQDNISTEPNSDNYGHDANVPSNLENHTFLYDKMDNSSSLDTISKNSYHLCIQPPTNVSTGSEPIKDTFERQDPVEGSQINDAVDDIYTDSSTAESDKNSANFPLDDNDTVDRRLDESANAHGEDNNLSTAITELDNDNSHVNGSPSSQMLKSHTSRGDRIGNDFLLDARLKDSPPCGSRPNADVTVDSGPHEDTLERQKTDVSGPEFHAKDKTLMLLTSKKDNIKNEDLSCEPQGKMVPISLEIELEKEMDESNDKTISYGSQDEQRSRGFKTKEEQHVLNVGLVITEKKHIDYSNHASDDESANFSVAVVGRLGNSTKKGRRANTNSLEDIELNKKNNHAHEITAQSNQELINPTSMDDKMEFNSPLDTRPNKSSSFSKKSYASTIKGSEHHEDTIEEQKPVARDSESLVEDKTFIKLEPPYGISSGNVLEHRVSKISSNNTGIILGNGVDFNASKTQTLNNSLSKDNINTRHGVAANELKSSKKQKKSSKSQNTNGATRQSNLKPETKTRRQRSPKHVRNSKSNMQGKPKRVLQLKRGEKAFNKESIESIRYMGSEKLQGILAAVVKWLFPLYLIQVFMLPVDGTPVPALTQWQQYKFCTKDYDFINQSLAIKSLVDIRRPGCAFMAPAVPYFYSCSMLNALVFFNNRTCLEMFTTDLKTQSWQLEYGTGYNGNYLESVRGELFSDETVKAKVDRYEKGDGPQARGYIQSTTAPAPPSTNGTTSKPLDRPSLSRIIAPLAGLAFLILVLLFFAIRCMSKLNTQSPTANAIELQVINKDGDDTNKGLLSNGTSEPQHKNRMAET
ncbi:uncharacterized protein [Aquarana catesbeiana]|uniref:uncharacterized protein isoform X2 n=1 Tax=Aquarana catesbeiana TaxID=8400 RepID=UPI003CC9B97C